MCIAVLNSVVKGIRPNFEEKKRASKSKKGKKKQKAKDPNKRYKHVYVRVHHKKNGNESSYSSLQSEWQSIDSEQEQIKSVSTYKKELNSQGKTQQQAEEEARGEQNPFNVKEEESGDEADRN